MVMGSRITGAMGEGDSTAAQVLGTVEDPLGILGGQSRIRAGNIAPAQQQYLGGSAAAALAQQNESRGLRAQQFGFQNVGLGQQQGFFGAANAEQARQLEARNQQMGLANALAAQAAGQGPSLAQSQFQQAQAQAANQTMAMAGAARGNPNASMREAMRANAAAGMGSAAQSAQIRAQEQMAAQQQLAGVLANVRGGDQSVQQLQTQAGLGMGQQALGFGSQALTAEGMRQQQLQAQLQANTSIEQANLQARTEQERLRLDAAKAEAEANKGLLGGVIGAVGSILSDERAKGGARPADAEVADLLARLGPKAYRYKREHQAEGGSGQQFGLMAQDLEASAMGSAMVKHGPDGLRRVDVGKAALGGLAATAHVNRRVDELDKKIAAVLAKQGRAA